MKETERVYGPRFSSCRPLPAPKGNRHRCLVYERTPLPHSNAANRLASAQYPLPTISPITWSVSRADHLVRVMTQYTSFQVFFSRQNCCAPLPAAACRCLPRRPPPRPPRRRGQQATSTAWSFSRKTGGSARRTRGQGGSNAGATCSTVVARADPHNPPKRRTVVRRQAGKLQLYRVGRPAGQHDTCACAPRGTWLAVS